MKADVGEWRLVGELLMPGDDRVGEWLAGLLEAEVDVAERAGSDSGALEAASPRELREKLRPIVLEILREELERMRRQKG